MKHSKPVRLETAPTVVPFGRHLSRLVGTVSNSANAVRLETAPTGPR